MRYRVALVGFAGALGLILAGVAGASAEDGTAVYQKRDDAMKEMGRNFYRPIGNVAKGTAQFGPETTAAAAAVDKVAKTLSVAFFAPGSDVKGSNLKPEAATQQDKVAKYIADMQAATAKLAAATDKDGTVAAFQAANATCNACHNDFRKPAQ